MFTHNLSQLPIKLIHIFNQWFLFIIVIFENGDSILLFKYVRYRCRFKGNALVSH